MVTRVETRKVGGCIQTGYRPIVRRPCPRHFHRELYQCPGDLAGCDGFLGMDVGDSQTLLGDSLGSASVGPKGGVASCSAI
jgi:hypothetical protein